MQKTIEQKAGSQVVTIVNPHLGGMTECKNEHGGNFKVEFNLSGTRIYNSWTFKANSRLIAKSRTSSMRKLLSNISRKEWIAGEIKQIVKIKN
jgi:NAD dependent epimerase/dehydratase family enzyme